MSITVLVRSGGGETRLTFDGTHRVVLGRGAGCDVRLPDPSVSVRHASIRAQGADFVLVDEGSLNGTFVGDVRISANTSRLVKSGDHARLGRVWIELRVDSSPVTRDLAAATRDLALAMIGDAVVPLGERAPRIVVAEGADQGAELVLTEEGRSYVVGRGVDCDLALSDADAPRKALEIVRRGAAVTARDLGGRNPSWIGDVRADPGAPLSWRASQMARVGRTVLALREPLVLALAAIEQGPDAPLAASEAAPPPPVREVPAGAPVHPDPPPPTSAAPVVAIPTTTASRAPATRRRGGWTVTDFVVMAAALAVLGLSVAALLWLLKPVAR